MCGPFKRNTWDSTFSHNLYIFTATNYGTFSFQHWNPGFGGLVWGWDPLLLMGGPLQWRYLLIFIRHTHQTVSRLYPSLPVSMWLLLHTLSCRTSVQLDLRWFSVTVVL